MITSNLPNRKQDLLDVLIELRNRRRIAYESGNSEKVTAINTEIKNFRLRNGWNEEDAHSEFMQNEKHCEIPFKAPIGNPLIVYDLLNESGNPRGLSLDIIQLSKHNSNSNC